MTLLPACGRWGAPLERMPHCPRCGEDELGMLRPGYAFCYVCGHVIEEPQELLNPPQEQVMQKPTVGRIVHYRSDRPQDPKGQPYPAVITHVWSDQCVNLHVLGDGSFPLVRQSPPHAMPTSVMLGNEPGQWSWPPRAE